MSNYKIYPGHEIFPIRTDTACLLKWAWSTVNIERGETSSCHRTNYDTIDPDNFSNFHNLPTKIHARERMIAGEWPGRGCEYCKNVEDHGGTSDRQMILMRSHGLDKIPPELLDNPKATEVTPIILEIYFNNTCNLSCVYCGPSISSKWNDEIQKFGKIQIEDFSLNAHTPDKSSYNKMVEDLWKYLVTDDRYKSIRNYQLLGGESLLQKELDASIDFWHQHPNPSLTFNLISNIMLPPKLFVEKMQRFHTLVDTESIYRLELTASLDCWGPQQEYVRHGLDLDTWTHNFEYLLDKPWVKPSIHSCITSLTIKTMPALIEKIVEWNQKLPEDMQIDHSFDFVIGSDGGKNGLHPCLFGPDIFEKDFEKILALMPENTENQRLSKKQMQGQANFVKNSIKDKKRINLLKAYLDELDRRRNTNWHTLFPWLLDL